MGWTRYPNIGKKAIILCSMVRRDSLNFRPFALHMVWNSYKTIVNTFSFLFIVLSYQSQPGHVKDFWTHMATSFIRLLPNDNKTSCPFWAAWRHRTTKCFHACREPYPHHLARTERHGSRWKMALATKHKKTRARTLKTTQRTRRWRWRLKTSDTRQLRQEARAWWSTASVFAVTSRSWHGKTNSQGQRCGGSRRSDSTPQLSL